MAGAVMFLKAAGTHPPLEGVLTRLAQVRSVHSFKDIQDLVNQRAEVVILDMRIPSMEGGKILETLKSVEIIIMVDASLQPSRLLGRLASLGGLRAKGGSAPTVAQIGRLLGISQEALARILNVSVRTAHRWLKGARPRPRPELDQLIRVVGLMRQALPGDDFVRTYVNHPNPAFSGEKPITLLMRGDFEGVAADLIALQEGVYE